MTVTKLTLENEYGTISIEINKTDVTLPTFSNELIKPILLAASYPESVIEKYIPYVDE